jgi:hypothetical protein
MNRHNTTKQRVIRTGFHNYNTFRSSMGKERGIRTWHNKIIKGTRPFDALDQFVTQRTYHRVTIRNQVLKILRDTRKVQRIVHNKNEVNLTLLRKRK